MKKRIFALLFISSISSTSLVFAQTSPSCLDLSSNLSRGVESAAVLKLQNFLSAKGFLKATPNGYFGPGTLAAVKAYQKSVGLSQVGNTGPMTRAAIKKDSCVASTAAPQPTTNPAAPPTTATTTAAPQNPSIPAPSISSIDLVTLFAGGQTDWDFSIYGSNFSSSSNTVTLRNTETRKTYVLPTLYSATGTAILLPKNLTGTAFPCGTNCNELLTAGQYEITVITTSGQSDSKLITIRPFILSVQNSTLAALPATGTGNKFGTLTFSTSVSVVVQSVLFSTGTSTISGGGLGVTLKDEIAGSSLTANTTLNAFQSAFIGAYADTNNIIAGTVLGDFTVKVQDYIGKKTTTFTSPSILVTVAGVL